MQNWDDLKYCLALDEFRTMTAAAKALGTNTATVSRRIERLTEEAGQPLFTRQNCQWMATTLGQELSAVARRIEERFHAAEINASILKHFAFNLRHILQPLKSSSIRLVRTVHKFHQGPERVRGRFLLRSYAGGLSALRTPSRSG